MVLEELLKEKTKELEDTRKELRSEKEAFIKMYNQYVKEKEEAERLNKMLEEMFMKKNTFLVENGIICKKNKEIERLHSIIKEVREWVVKNSFSNGISSSTFFMPNAYANELLKILDKEKK